MRRPRVSVAALMGGVLFIAVGFAVLKNPTPLGASIPGTLLRGSLLIAVLGAVLRRGPRRAFGVGFAICGAGNALLSACYGKAGFVWDVFRPGACGAARNGAGGGARS